MMVARTSLYCEPDQTLFTRGANTESDNAPARKIGSGHARLERLYDYYNPYAYKK